MRKRRTEAQRRRKNLSKDLPIIVADLNINIKDEALHISVGTSEKCIEKFLNVGSDKDDNVFLFISAIK